MRLIGFSSSMLRGIDVSAGSLGKLAKLALGRARTVAILPAKKKSGSSGRARLHFGEPYPGALDVNATKVAMLASKPISRHGNRLILFDSPRRDCDFDINHKESGQSEIVRGVFWLKNAEFFPIGRRLSFDYCSGW